MSYTFEDFHRDLAVEWLKRQPPGAILRGISIEDRLRGLPLEDRLLGLPPEDRLRGLPIEELLRGLDDAGRARLKALLGAQATADQRH